MTLDNIIIGFAFSAGAIAFLNPCGFAMLPVYVSYFIKKNSQLQQQTMTTTINSSTQNSKNPKLLILVRRISYGALAGLLVTAGFIAIFGLTGLGVSAVGTGIAKYFPWIAVLSGIIIIGIGIAKIVGKEFHVNIPIPMKIMISNRNTVRNDENSKDDRKNRSSRRRSSHLNFFLFGIGYAIASLSCTLPIFLLVVIQGLSAGGIAEGSIVFLSYALGMGTVMIAVSLAIGISNQTFVKWLRRLEPKMNIITSVVLILAGSYLVYYNLVIGKLLLL